jgi:hypothetical protein
MKNLMKKRVRGVYEPSRAWNKRFPKPVREEAARRLAEQFEDEADAGEYDWVR